jgi:dihydrofolate synthase/folylpolyglutamate synthase
MPSAPIVSREGAIEFLYGRIDYERAAAIPYGDAALRLERMRELLARLGNPHQGLPVVHVAGTKGKGSTACMIAAVLTAAGYRTGLFSSPHLDRVEERMAVDGAAQSTAALIGLTEHVRPHVEAMDRAGTESAPTYFEISTAMAYLHFRQSAADIAVLEVGLGGRLDSTNVCEPAVSIITSISFDHMRQLGNTLAAIAGEKAGIIKPGIPVVSGVTQPEPRDVIRAVARERGSRLVELDTDFRCEYRPPRMLNVEPALAQIDYVDLANRRELNAVELASLGRHQGVNAALAIAGVAVLAERGWQIPEAVMRRALATVTCPARIEVVSRFPTVILDTAHNVASVDALLSTLDESFERRERILLFATTQDKDYAGMLGRLLPAFDHVLLTRYRLNPRGVPIADLAREAERLGSNAICCQTPEAAWQRARSIAQPSDLICIAGSFYLAGELRPFLAAQPAAASTGAARNIA